MKAKVLLLLLGVAIGLALAIFTPRLRERLVPRVWQSAPTEGVVEEKRSEEGRLLLTLVTADGAVLATFTQRVAEIDLLVAAGDTVGLALDGYRPFVDDPEIVRVEKADAGQPEPPRPAADGSPAVGADRQPATDPPAVAPGGEPAPGAPEAAPGVDPAEGSLDAPDGAPAKGGGQPGRLTDRDGASP